MRSNNTYLLQLYVKSCKINIKQSGSIGLLLRAGRSQSHVTDLKQIGNGIVNFNTHIKLNIDESALDTQRCSLTLNFVSSQGAKRVVGIIVINIPQIGEQVQKTFKVTSTPDKEAEIQLSICVNEVDQNKKVVKQRQKQVQKQIQKQVPLPKNNSFGSLMMSITSKNEQKPTSPPSQSAQKLNLNSKRSQLQSENVVESYIVMVQKLQREKQLLKQLLKLQISKSQKAYFHLRNIIQILQTSIGVSNGFGTDIRTTMSGDQTPSNLKRLSSEPLDFNKLSLALNNSSLGIVKQNVHGQNPSKISAIKSKIASHIQRSQIGSQRSTSLIEVLNGLKKTFQITGKSKDQVRNMFEKIRSQPQIEVDMQKIKILKTRIDKSYINLLTKQTISKQELLKHKIDLNKILDQVVNPNLK